MELPAFLELLTGVQPYQNGYNARCPAHDDRQASLSVGLGDEGGIVLRCHAMCDTADVLKTMGLSFADLAARPHKVAEYHYTDGNGRVLWTVERWMPKDFRCRPCLPLPSHRVLYAAGWIAKARAENRPILVVEGEKDAESAHARNIPATTCVGGAGKWLRHYSEELAGLDVIVVADNDDPGKAHARQVGEALADVAALVRLAKPRAGKDLSDHLAEGFTVEQLDPLEQEGELIEHLLQDLPPGFVDWAWTGRIPLGKLTMIDGDPGDGKSVLTCDLAARWSSHLKMPDGSANPFDGPVHVIMVSAEDDSTDTISPRLRAHGAAGSRVSVITSGSREETLFGLEANLAALERLVKRRGAKVVILDPLMAFLPETTDSSGDSSVRRALGPLMMMARRLGVAVIVVRHLNKSSSGKALYRGGGSIAFSGLARTAYLVTRDLDDPTARVLAAVKNNLGPLGPSLVYHLDTDPVYRAARITWAGEVSASAQELLDGSSGPPPSVRVTKFLMEICSGEPLPWKEIAQLGHNAGHKEHALRSARDQVLEKVAGPGGARDVTWRARYGLAQLPFAGGAEGSPVCHLAPQTGNQGLTSANAIPFSHLPICTEVPPEALNPACPDDDTPMTEEERREAELAALPMICDQCGSTDALKFADPDWAVRCRAHHPNLFTGADS